MNKSVLLLLYLSVLLEVGQGNIWDNIYSQSYADSPIILEESLSL